MNTPLEFSSAPESRQFLQQQVLQLRQQLAQTAGSVHEQAATRHELAEILLELGDPEQQQEAWQLARQAFATYRDAEQWEQAVRCCDQLFRAEQPLSVQALGNGLWLAVACPVDPELSVLLLNHLVDATPDSADGAAVAAAVAHYIADLRLEGSARENLMFLTSALLGKVAERHSQVHSQAEMNAWMERLELLNPAQFLPRLGQMLEALTEGQWWYDRDELRARMPVN
ncbi:MAG TPA: hypothetical protein PLB10_10815 [Thiolinea sp.]|nr:hypothetical protein [Thiolinea sp.]